MRKLLGLFTFASLVFLPTAAFATIATSDTGLTTTAGQANYSTDETSGNITVFVGKYIIGPVLGVVGIIFLVLMLYAGLLWMTAAGNADNVKKAKDILVNSVIGLVIVAAAYTITAAVFNAVSTGSITAAT